MSESMHSHTRFAKRRKLLTVREDAMQVAQDIKGKLNPQHSGELRAMLDELHPADLADAMLFLSVTEERIVFSLLDNIEAAEVLDEVDVQTEANLVGAITSDKLADILEELPPDEGADVVGGLSQADAGRVLGLTNQQIAGEIRSLLAYPAD